MKTRDLHYWQLFVVFLLISGLSFKLHAPAAEKQAVQQEWAIKRTLIGSNEFYIVGPPEDPAGIAAAKTAVHAYRKISESKSLFLARGDNSGTHKKELDIWKASGITPSGDWYVLSKGFMLDTLKNADSLGGYFSCATAAPGLRPIAL